MVRDETQTGQGLFVLPHCPQNPVCLGRGRRLFRVDETHLLGAFRKLSFVDEFCKLAMRRSDPLALGAGQLLGVHQKERMRFTNVLLAVEPKTDDKLSLA